MKYTVSMRVDGRIDVEVEAANPDEAREAAIQAFEDADISKMDTVDAYPVTCYDKNGDIVKSY